MATLTPQQNTALKGYLTNIPDFSTQTKLGDFLSMYFVCHILAGKLVEYKSGKKAKILRVDSLKSAVRTFGLQINDNIIDEIFSLDKGNRGNYSCRTLRNNYVHNLSKNDKNEIDVRFDNLKSYMEQWINLFK